MTDEEITYTTQTAKSVRGLEARTISQWEQRGWEFVSQRQGRVSTEITFRRPKTKASWKKWVIIGGAVALAFAAIIVNGVIRENGDRQEAQPSPLESSTERAPSKSPASSTTPMNEPSASPASANTVVTADNDPEFARILALPDYCSPDISSFAQAYAGQTIRFDGYIGAMNNHDGATTRYDILISAGDFDPDHSAGPAFQFRDENLVSDLHYAGPVPDSIGVGQNVTITAEVTRFEGSSCLFLLEPVATSFR